MIKEDPWVLQVVQGYKIEFITVPVQQCQPHKPFCRQRRKLCESGSKGVVNKTSIGFRPTFLAEHGVQYYLRKPRETTRTTQCGKASCYSKVYTFWKINYTSNFFIQFQK